MFSHVYRLVLDNKVVNKIVIIGIIIAVAIGIGITASSISMNSSENNTIQFEDESGLEEVLPVEEELVLEEVLPVEEEVEEPEEKGRDLTVELSESIGLTSP